MPRETHARLQSLPENSGKIICINISECSRPAVPSMRRSEMRSVCGTSRSAPRLSDIQICRFDSSSIIDRAGYDDRARLLCLRFLDTGCYFYFDEIGRAHV